MKKLNLIPLLIVMAGFCNQLSAQIFSAGATGITIKSGTIFSADKLSITPSADITLSNVSLSKAATLTHNTHNPYIARVYQFSSTTAPFTGSIQFGYETSELNGISEANLQLNVHNGTNWQFITSNTNNTTSHFIISNPLSGIALNELTLGNELSPLPVSWLSFTAEKQNHNVLLKWSTGYEQNTLNFMAQHSTNGSNWSTISTLPAARNSTTTQHYNTFHYNPANGINYYRILQTDIDGRINYSEQRIINFTANEFLLMKNPVTNGNLQLLLSKKMQLSFYNVTGKLLWQKELNAGSESIDVSRYAKGIYILKGNNSSHKLIIQ